MENLGTHTENTKVSDCVSANSWLFLSIYSAFIEQLLYASPQLGHCRVNRTKIPALVLPTF